MSAQHEDDAGFWPGYVAAVACLVQSLLLISGVMAITIFMIGLQAGKRVDAPHPVLAPPLSAPPAEDSVPDRLDLFFPFTVSRMDDASRQRVRQEMERQRMAGVERWVIRLKTDTQDSLKRRAAFLHVMEVRNMMLGAGVSGTHIEIRLEEALASASMPQGHWLTVQAGPARKPPAKGRGDNTP